MANFNRNVFTLKYDAEFECEEWHEVFVFDSFEKAKDKLIELVREWQNDGAFKTDILNNDDTFNTEWNDDYYDGFYNLNEKENRAYFHIEERDNVVDYLDLYVEETTIL